MTEPKQPDLHEVLSTDTRYAIEAYEFLYQALAYTQRMLGRAPKPKRSAPDPQEKPHHVTGPELLEGIRRFALEQYGMMARVVFELWGVRSTADFGSMVYLLIEAGLWRRSESDRFEDFEGLYDFAQAFEQEYRIEIEGAL